MGGGVPDRVPDRVTDGAVTLKNQSQQGMLRVL